MDIRTSVPPTVQNNSFKILLLPVGLHFLYLSKLYQTHRYQDRVLVEYLLVLQSL